MARAGRLGLNLVLVGLTLRAGLEMWYSILGGRPEEFFEKYGIWELRALRSLVVVVATVLVLIGATMLVASFIVKFRASDFHQTSINGPKFGQKKRNTVSTSEIHRIDPR